MRVTSVEHGLDLIKQEGGERSPGLHVSDLYNALYAKLDPKRYSGEGGPNTTKMAMGLAWEQYLERLLIAQGMRAQRPGEFRTKEGIIFSPDLHIQNGADRLGEIKLTYMRMEDDLSDPKFDKWLTQAKAYAHNLDLNCVRFYVLFVCGNYRDKRDPELRTYDCEFSKREMEDNWTMLVDFGKQQGLLR